jgi:signal transduction histidine kinase
MQMHGEFRALRASILKLWARSDLVDTGASGAEEIARFNQAVDQALADSVERYSSEVSKSRDMFLAVLGHDLRGPLTGIRMAADLLAKPELSESTRLQIATRISRACSAISYLSSDLLEYTRARLGSGIPVEKSDCDMANVCAEALDAMRGSYPDRHFAHRAGGDLRACCDPRRIQQVLWNLLDNAVHHSDPAKPITLEAEGLQDATLITVSSFGEPIPAESLPSIFEPLLRIGPTGRRDTGHPLSGVGLGLYIVREIVRAHGGSVDVSSDKDEGTIFTVRLPKHSP